ncbi:MAG: NADP-dependent oxidoreductase [Chloroflexota bacterium]|nr:NADP-dependent oxidoreductase [Chloroflexota bacterium]
MYQSTIQRFPEVVFLRAFAIDEFGADGSVHELPDPTPGEGQVRVRVEAASVNPADIGMLSGAYKDFMPHHFPLVPGLDLAGTVDTLGPGVQGLTVGDPVFGVHGKMSVGEGTFAEYAIASVGTIARRPEDVDPPFGTALSLAGVSALEMVDATALREGDVVVIVGATGGIGSIATQLVAARHGIPLAVTRTVNHAYARELGAAETLDYETGELVNAVRAAHPEGIAAVLDMVGDKEAIGRLAELVRPGGHVVSMMGAADADALASLKVTGVNVRTQATTEKLERLAGFVAIGTLRRPEITTLPLGNAGQALAEIAGRHVRGKLVIQP